MDGDSSPADARISVVAALVPAAIDRARSAGGFAGRWKSVISRLELLPSCISDLAGHPCFSKNPLCRDLLRSVSDSLAEAARLSELCRAADGGRGKLLMQSDLDSLCGKLDLNLRDCRILIRTSVLGDHGTAISLSGSVPGGNVRELVARLQLGDVEAKRRAIDALLEAESSEVAAAIGRSDVAALVQLMSSAACLKLREKAAAVLCSISGSSGACDGFLVSEGAIPQLIRMAEKGGCSAAKEMAMVSLQKLSGSSPEAARAMVRHGGGVRVLIAKCGEVAAAAGALKNVSALAELRKALAEAGLIPAMVRLLNGDGGGESGSKEQAAAECLRNMTSGNNKSLKKAVVSAGGSRELLGRLDRPSPMQEHAIAAIRNLIGTAPIDELALLSRLIRALEKGTPGAKEAAAMAICRMSSSSPETKKKVVVESGSIVPLLSRMMGDRNGAREAVARALASLIGEPRVRREVRKDGRSLPCLVQMLDPGQQSSGAGAKYAVVCLLFLASSRKSRRTMVSHGAIGYLKKLSEMEIAGARKLLDVLQRRHLLTLFPCLLVTT